MHRVSVVPPAHPFFLPGSMGDLFAMYYQPGESVVYKGDILFVPPFAEEMNISRHFVSLQARELARSGVGVLLLDLYGCGDSSGEFHEAGWGIWKRDLFLAVEWLRERGRKRISLWGMHLGALLAMDFASTPQLTLEKVILWQPTLSGKEMITQFLLLRVAAAAILRSEIDESTQSLMTRLMSGEHIEVAGYKLTADLVRAINGLDLAPLGKTTSAAIKWLEVVSGAGHSISPARLRVIEQWKNDNVRVSLHTIVGNSLVYYQNHAGDEGLSSALRDIFESHDRENS